MLEALPADIVIPIHRTSYSKLEVDARS